MILKQCAHFTRESKAQAKGECTAHQSKSRTAAVAQAQPQRVRNTDYMKMCRELRISPLSHTLRAHPDSTAKHRYGARDVPARSKLASQLARPFSSPATTGRADPAAGR